MILRRAYVFGTHEYKINMSATAHTPFRHSTDFVHNFQIAEEIIREISLFYELLRICVCSLRTHTHAIAYE